MLMPLIGYINVTLWLLWMYSWYYVYRLHDSIQ